MTDPKYRTACKIIERLRKKGFEAFLVGGCVRDMYMRKKPKDYDILTTARPAEIRKYFKKTIPVGEKFGVMIVREKGENYEVATARKDMEYKDGRHPAGVVFCNVKDDVFRRDFTVNALLFDPAEKKYIDLIGGKDDMRKKIIKTVGLPDERFGEDALRLLRAVRFSARLGFKIEKNSYDSIIKNKRKIRKISAERIKDELLKMIESGRFYQALADLDKTGLLAVILPEISALKGVPQPKKFHPEGDVFIHTLLAVKNIKQKTNPVTVLSALFHDVGKPAVITYEDRIRFHGHDRKGEALTEKILRRLRFPNEIIRKVSAVVGNHMYFMDVKKMRLAKIKRLIMRETYPSEIDLHRADCLASHKDLSNYRFLNAKEKIFRREPLELPKIVSGHDLIKLGFKPGPKFKEMLSEVQNAFLEKKILTKAEGMALIRSKYGSQ